MCLGPYKVIEEPLKSTWSKRVMDLPAGIFSDVSEFGLALHGRTSQSFLSLSHTLSSRLRKDPDPKEAFQPW